MVVSIAPTNGEPATEHTIQGLEIAAPVAFQQCDPLDVALTMVQQTLGQKDSEIRRLQSSLDAILRSRSWRWTNPLRKIEMLRRRLRPSVEPTIRIDAQRQITPSIDRALSLLSSEIAPLQDIAPACVIVPVYNGLDHLKRLLPSLLRNTDGRHQIILIDDCSPDIRIGAYLQTQAVGHRNVRVLRNERNLGFVASVNRGASYSNGDFAILNTDTEVSPNWLERLLAPMATDPNIASTTPFSNAATIFSFPDFLADGKLIQGVSVEETDKAFRSLSSSSGVSIDAPTGVGFCMGINGRIWRAIGAFDELEFGQGYGEENDWCQRAIASGYRNVLVPNLFVYHAHGGSFGTEQKSELQRRNSVALSRRWPTYEAQVSTFISRDDWSVFRIAAILNLCLSRERKPLIIFDHSLGGGANSYRKRLVEEALLAERAVLLLTWNKPRQVVDVVAMIGDLVLQAQLDDFQSLLKHKELLSGCELIYNNMVGWEKPLEHLEGIVAISTAVSAPLIVLFHDFYPICSSYTLLNSNSIFCGVPTDTRVCNQCLSRNENAMERSHDIESWRCAWQRVISAASEVRFFSPSGAVLAKRVFEIGPNKITIIPHSPLVDFEGRRFRLAGDELVIGVVGTFNVAKGIRIIDGIAQQLAHRQPSARVVIFGDVDPTYVWSSTVNVFKLGRYDRDRLPDWLEACGVRVCILPSIIPETFSYVTQELMALKVPLVCFDLGAPAERVRQYELGRVASEITAESMLDAVAELHDELQ